MLGEKKLFGTTKEGKKIFLYTLTNKNGMKAVVMNYGANLVQLWVPDKSGKMDDIVLGYDKAEYYFENSSFLGATVGPNGNRIADAAFSIEGKKYCLKANEGKNNLHSDENFGYHKQIWDVETRPDSVVFFLDMADGMLGFPGNKKNTVTYTLTEENELKIHYSITTDKKTILNPTNHSYFNLSAKDSKIYDHQLMIKSDQIACADENGLPTGEFLDVENTPFDFKSFHEIGERIHDDDEQLKFVGGYDHCFMLKDEKDQAVLYDKESGRKLTITTTLPCMQLYAGNFLAGGSDGKFGKPYENRDGVALEPQFLPNSMNIEKKPRVILRKDEEYEAVTTYRFETE